MTKLDHTSNLLFKAFQADHIDLAENLLLLRMALSEGQLDDLRAQAARIIESAGAHIAFEEFDFYPVLEATLSESEVSRMYLEHAEGLALMTRIANLDGGDFGTTDFLIEVLQGLQKLEHHVADCGNLFEAVGNLDEAHCERLLNSLYDWHKRAPSWSEIEALSKDNLK